MNFLSMTLSSWSLQIHHLPAVIFQREHVSILSNKQQGKQGSRAFMHIVLPKSLYTCLTGHANTPDILMYDMLADVE